MPRLILPHEWLAVVLMLFSICGFLSFSYNHYSESLPVAYEKLLVDFQKDTIEVMVSGSIRHPGVHVLPLNSNLRELLSLAEPLPEADLKGLRYTQKLRDGQTIVIPERPLITIYLSGAVDQPGVYRVRQGTTLTLIPQVCALNPQADTKSLRSKRLLIDEEHIHIPFKS